MSNLYVPVLKAKEGEFAALEYLPNKTKESIIPLLEIPEVPFDHAAGMPSKTLEQHVAAYPDRIIKAWPSREFYLETPHFDGSERLSNGSCALEELLSVFDRRAAQAIPVVRSNASASCLESIRNRPTRRTCLRLTVGDFSEDSDTDALVDDLMAQMGRESAANVDLMIDIGEISKEGSTAVLVARSLLSMLPKKQEWNQVIFSAASFPEDLSGISSQSVDRIPRQEWRVWKTLQKKPSLLPSNFIYSDNTISHPTSRGIDPRVMRMSAAIRYTSTDEWVVVKGRGVGRYGFEQYFDLCKRLVELPDFAGENFCWGDRYIADCAQGMQGPGNATTWRKVGVNHHITLIAYQLSNSSEL